ncbi:sodium:proton antiporter [Tropicimonas sp. IMCC34043]|uniref:cation:proton antiporter n=1 Tax=Tropicimonas sp. IMCC34043 TaxID=2248760 RepID=UPI000E24E0BD|nr:cation:proton antiporter [Tropicimonas sp. IMCC34043]
MVHLYAAIAILILLYTLFSRGLAGIGITMPMVFLAVGVVAALQVPALSHDTGSMFHRLAELTLALLLFADATELTRGAARRIQGLAGRMLLIGLPVAIVLGLAVNLVLLPDWPFWEACVLAALLAPTDAALGKPIMGDPKIPETLRDTINAESGLNDGLAFPFVVFFAFLAVGEDTDAPNSLVLFILAQVGIGLAVGVAVGILGGWLRRVATARNGMDPALDGVMTLALVGSMFFLAEILGGNSFVAVFAGGFAFANAAGGKVIAIRDFLEEDGQFLAILSFLLIGAYLVPLALTHADLATLGVVFLSILVVRPVAIWLSLMGTSTRPNERLFLGWFGPRGLATALFAIFVVLDFDELAKGPEILVVATSAVLVSAYVHGLTARWAAQIFRLGPVNGTAPEPPAVTDPDGRPGE